MNAHEKHLRQLRFNADVDTYRHDHHCATDTISTLDGREARELLLDIYAAAPWSTSKQLATSFPLDRDRHDEVERRVQQLLPPDVVAGFSQSTSNWINGKSG